MTAQIALRRVPTDDRAWLLAALDDALRGGVAVLPDSGLLPENTLRELERTQLPAQTALVLHTSGSSGVPKSVALSAAALRASAEATHDRLGGPGQWLVALPVHLVSGVQMLVRSIVANTAPVFVDGSFEPSVFFAQADQLTHDRRYTSLVPVQFERVLAFAEHDAEAAALLRRFDAILVGGQSVSVALRQRAHELGVALQRSYGMTETAGGCVYDGVELGDTLVRIRAGEVQLAGPTLALEYLNNPALTAERFVTDGDTRWFRTGDSGNLLGGMLRVTGRLDRVIISGGTNVSLDEVERVLSEVPGWAAVVAVGVADPIWGERVALVVPEAEAAASESDAHDALKRALGAAAVPVLVRHDTEIPLLAGGKPDRVAVATLVAPPG